MVATPKVMIGVSTAGFLRSSAFLDYMYLLEKPANTVTTISHGASPAKARNLIIESALTSEATHVLFMDDDMAPPPYALMRLLAHDKDIVTGLYLMRSYPHMPLVFDEAFDDGRNKHLFLTPDQQGLVKITNAGLGFVLVKIDVFKNMTKYQDKYWVTLGEIDADGWCDDISFFNRASRSGYDIYCDLDCRIGHLAQTVVTPHFNGLQWVTTYQTGSLDAIQVPQIVPEIANGPSYNSDGTPIVNSSNINELTSKV